MYPRAVCGAVEGITGVAFIDSQGKMTLQHWVTRRRGEGRPRCCSKLGNQWGTGGGVRLENEIFSSELGSKWYLSLSEIGKIEERKEKKMERSSARKFFSFFLGL